MLDVNQWSLVNSLFSDLRVTSDTEYTFHCAVCQGQVSVPLAWIMPSDVPSGPFRREDLRELGRKYGGVFQPVQCVNCQNTYLVREDFTETSYGAFRVKIESVWKVSEPAA